MVGAMRSVIASLLALLATLAGVELGARLLIGTGLLDAPHPRDRSQEYWRGDHPELGVWHAPGKSFRHHTSCYDVTYRANSVGARDAERPLHSTRPRVVALGDSFMEGWGVEEQARLSNQLEALTGVPHLNFAMSHFSPYQAYLAYRSIASRFDHDAVLLGVLPTNDLLEVDFEASRRLAHYRFRYRPYLVGEPPDFEHMYHREPTWRRFLRYHSYAGNALIVAFEQRAREAAVREVESAGQQEWFYDFEPRQLELLEAVLAKLAAAAEGKRVAVVLIPAKIDLRSFARRGPDPLSAALRTAGARDGYRVVNLLPAMAGHRERWPSYYLPCDYHWSAEGNAVAAQLVRDALGDAFFGLH